MLYLARIDRVSLPAPEGDEQRLKVLQREFFVRRAVHLPGNEGKKQTESGFTL